MSTPPDLILFAGPNGAGKSTLRNLLYRDSPIPFINADLIAAATFGDAAPERAYEAAALAESERQRCFAARQSFMFETVLSDPHGEKVAFLGKAREAGYRVTAHFVGLDSPDRSLARVTQRVYKGGHDVPEDKIAGRYPRVLQNLIRLMDDTDDLFVYDNSSEEAPYRLLAHLQDGELISMSRPLPDWLAPVPLAARKTAETELL